MKKTRTFTGLSIALAMTSLLSACTTENRVVETTPPKTEPVAVVPAIPAPPPKSPEQIAEETAHATAQTELDNFIFLYNNGDYHGVIKHSSSTYESVKAYKDMQLETLKYTAFSYCLIGRTLLCKQQFEKAVRLDRSFDLKPGEKGHPLWGPVFERVKKKEGSK